MDKYNNYRKEYPRFIYRSYTVEDKGASVDISYDFEIEGLACFNPGWSFPKPASCSVENDLTFERLVFSLGMVEAVSYWKAVCSPEMRVDCGSLDNQQIEWWKKLYFSGLGEFFYVNGITADKDDFINIVTTGSFKSTNESSKELSGCLVPIGGGKDSALTLETLTQAGKRCMCYAINDRCSIRGTVETAGLPLESLITVKRRFDRSLVDLNAKGFLNGHTPFSAIVAFSAEITAYLHGLKYIVLSNEASANESTVAGMDVNHQYSKSFEFERDYNTYEKEYLATGIRYFSFLRPLSEFAIARMFVQHEKYLSVFRSCNLGSKHSPDIWCGKCPKCLFVCLILSPFLTRDRLTDVFGRDMLNDSDMLNYFTELIGKSEHKPFECVGSIDEVNLAVTLAIKNCKSQGEELPLLFREYVSLGMYNPEDTDEKYREMCCGYNENNLLPQEFAQILKKEMERLL